MDELVQKTFIFSAFFVVIAGKEGDQGELRCLT